MLVARAERSVSSAGGVTRRDESMPRALVTGASGFVGSNLARILAERGWTVRGLVRGTSKLDLLDGFPVELAAGSLDDAESLRSAASGVDVVFHVAGRTAALRADQYARDNVEGTRRVAEACAAQPNPPALVMTSSLAAGGPGTMREPRVEGGGDAPVSCYGRSKLAAERAAAEFADRVPASVVRPPMVFGAGDRAGLTLFTSMQFLPFHWTPGLRGFPMSLVHVDDLCDALVAVAERGERMAPQPPSEAGRASVGRGAYYVTTDRPISYGELGRIAATAAGWAIAAFPLPRTFFRIAGMIGEGVGRVRGRPALLNIDKIREATAPGWVCRDDKIRNQLGYQSMATLEERFAETVAWYRANKWLK